MATPGVPFAKRQVSAHAMARGQQQAPLAGTAVTRARMPYRPVGRICGVAKPGRPKGSTRERVLQAADRLWGERGVRGASLDDIAREAAVTKPTVYYYFADKSALFTA